MKLFIPVHKSSMFTYDKERKTFIAEASTLGTVDGRVWDDACDVGFYIESVKTGTKILFVHVERVMDNSGELLYDIYEDNCLGPVHYTVHVLND